MSHPEATKSSPSDKKESVEGVRPYAFVTTSELTHPPSLPLPLFPPPPPPLQSGGKQQGGRQRRLRPASRGGGEREAGCAQLTLRVDREEKEEGMVEQVSGGRKEKLSFLLFLNRSLIAFPHSTGWIRRWMLPMCYLPKD